ncbi:hypothetical protein ACJMK2_025741 [Sinanodonta woodiana]|uniref:Ig-like domain-containing protein n=1 Tax=Sinanodonta woodiana TaxID=1069815 RepID=A0ABD3XHY1_SINWO
MTGNFMASYMLFSLLAHVYTSDGRTVQVIKGRHVSLSWTCSDINDVVIILHGSAPVVWVWDLSKHYVILKQPHRLQLNAETFVNSTAMFTLNILNVTINDAGEYKIKRLLDSKTFNDNGPKEIFVNADDNAHEVNVFETVVRFCYANCFPPCDIVWINTHGQTMIRGAELKLVNLTVDVNYTCQATNPINNKEKIFKAIYIKVKSVAKYNATMTTVDDKYRTGNHITFVYFVFPLILSITDRSSYGTYLTQACRCCEGQYLQEVNSSENYWTIVPNASGMMSTVVDANIKHCRTPMPIYKGKFPMHYSLQQSVSHCSLNSQMEQDTYMEPIHSRYVDLVDYIHPFHSPIASIECLKKNTI